MFTTIESLLDELDEQGQGQHTKNTINLVVNKVGELFKNSAKKVFGSNGRKRKTNTNKKFQIWFDNKCFETRKIFHKARNRYSFVKNRENRDAMRKASKQYKNQMNASYNKFQHSSEEDFDSLPCYTRAFRWICGIEKMEQAPHLSEEEKKAIEAKQNSIHETKTWRYILNINAVVLMTLAVFLWGFYA
ncbi:SGLT4 [Mytilus edulis]|uniref:SLC5A9 n=1 Tax=Mytilus edulis TaxID=6550 RepID=A0A8S3QSE1_MYTED|nr:SGLT4 [Mytilus edulis]